MSRRKFDDSSDESDICHRRKRVRPVCYTSNESARAGLSNLHLSTDITSQEGEWRPIQTTETEEEAMEQACGQDAELLVQNINLDDPLEIYKLFLTDSIIRFMVEQTNEYAVQSGIDKRTRNHQSCWVSVTTSEMKAFVGILLIMGIVQMPDIRLYWSENNMYGNACIKRVMKRDRFLAILKCLHFSDNKARGVEDPLSKIRGIVEEILCTFKSTVKPGKTVAIDESMILWRGRLRLRQYIKEKRHNYGIKLYKLCLPNGYTYDLDVQSEKSSTTSTSGHSYGVVEKLMDGLLFEHRTLYTDSTYSSVPLARSLLQKQTYLCGTVQQGGQFLPAEAEKKQKRGEIMAFENNSGIKFVKWTDTRTVCMLTTCRSHKCALIEKNPGEKRPDLVFDYNDAKRGVDLSDQMSSYYNCLRKTVKWYNKIVIQLLCGTAVVNAYYVHKRWGSRQLSVLKFREIIIEKLLAAVEVPIRQVPVVNAPPSVNHFLDRRPGFARSVRKRCKECYRKLSEQVGPSVAAKKAKRVTTFCPHCDNQPVLCLQCFKEIHDKK